MRRKRLLLWLVVGVVVLFGGFALLANRLFVPKLPPDYEIAVNHLRTMYAGPTTFNVSAHDDARTRIEKTPTGYILHGVMRSDHPDVAPIAKQSPTGEVRFAVSMSKVKMEGGWPYYGTVYVNGDVTLEPLK